MHRLLDLLIFLMRRYGYSDSYREHSSMSVRNQLKKVLSLGNVVFLVLSGLMMFAITAEVLYVALHIIGSLLSNAAQVIRDFPIQLDPVAIVQYVERSLTILLSATAKSFPLTWNAFWLWLLGTGVYAFSVLVWIVGVFRNVMTYDSPSKLIRVVVWGLFFMGIGLHFDSFMK